MNSAKTVDDFIRNAGDHRLELEKLRSILNSCGLNEEIKWGSPCYTLDGKNVVGIGAFKSYFGLWFFQGTLLSDEHGVLINAQEGRTKALRQWRMTAAKDIRPQQIRRYVKEAMQLVRDGKAIAPTRKAAMDVPPELASTLRKNAAVRKKFAALTPGRQREYADYIRDAKRAGTRLSRVGKIVPMIEAGKGLHDKYR